MDSYLNLDVIQNYQETYGIPSVSKNTHPVSPIQFVTCDMNHKTALQQISSTSI